MYVRKRCPCIKPFAAAVFFSFVFSGPVQAQVRDAQAAVSALAKLGIPMQRDGLGRVRWIEAIHGEFSDEGLGRLSGLPSLEWLEIGGGKVTDEGMRHLKDCRGLKRLYVHDVRLNGSWLSALGDLTRLEALSLQRTGMYAKALSGLRAPSLRVLNLSGDFVRDEDMAQVARFAGLEVLALQDTNVGGAGLARLDGMKRLNVLNLTNTRLVDADLEHFLTMPNLRIVHAAGCKISSQVIEDYKEKLPMLAIFQ